MFNLNTFYYVDYNYCNFFNFSNYVKKRLEISLDEEFEKPANFQYNLNCEDDIPVDGQPIDYELLEREF